MEYCREEEVLFPCLTVCMSVRGVETMCLITTVSAYVLLTAKTSAELPKDSGDIWRTAGVA